MSARPVVPGVHRVRKSPLWARMFVVFGTVLVLVSGVALVVGKFAYTQITGSINQQSLLPGGTENQAGRAVEGPINILLAGLDYRAGDPASANDQRADSIMWVHIPREHDRAYILSIPRDLLVPLAADPAAKYPGSDGDKINAAFAMGMQNNQGRPGGMRLLTQTVQQVTGAKFDMAGIIDWYGFTGITEQLGGVTMCLEKDIKSHHSDLTFPKGCRFYNAHSALELVRQRYDVDDGDYGRQKLQQQFIKQILKQATSKDVLTNPAKLAGIVKTAGNSLMLDLGGYDISDLVMALKGISADKIITMQVPHKPRTIGDTEYETLVDPLGGELFKALTDERIDEFLVQHPELATQLPTATKPA